MRDELKAFCRKHNINVLSESKRAAKMRPMSLSDVENGAKVYDTAQYDTEPLITVDIPESNLEELRALEEIFFRNIDSAHRRTLFASWMESQDEERQLRRSYTAVRQAYEHYQAMLVWVRENHCDFKDLDD